MNKILIVGPLISQHIQCWYSEFRRQKCDDINIFSLHSGGADFEGKVSEYSYSFFKNKLDFFIFLPVFIFLWWKIRPTVTNFHFLSSYGLLSLFIPKKNLILNTWGSDVNLVYSSNSKLKKLIIKLALRRFSWINTPAQHMKDKLISLGADPDKIEVFQYGITIEDKPLNWKKKQKGDRLVYISNRNWQDLYNIKSIVLGFCEYKNKTNANATLLVYGRGSEKEELEIKNVLKQYDIKVSSSVLFMGYVKKDDMLNQMKEADIYVSIPSRDGTPLSLLEAMSLGLYPIVSSIDANYEWIDLDNGIFINNMLDISEISDAFERSEKILLSQNNTFLKANFEKVKNKADMSVNVPRFHEKINSFLS
ncbi:glycosyltransferase family 4 protein [Vibrio casei]|uniref:Glycosyltransferase n=1 Tax=Vibrio casei TaxID=673372 RepID=A0A368LG91_9VIBR|nr:glycosyltransferase family 4 protein [Vibrio casei]RCS69125.1 glycosyltransferase [Vibrio casei]SJN37290.1 Glycosyltransferase [Vibrio casei]